MEKENDNFDTTIRIKESLRLKLENLKVHPNQSYNELILNIIDKKEEKREEETERFIKETSTPE